MSFRASHSHLDTVLQELRELIFTMGGLVEKAVEDASQAVIKYQPGRLKEVHSCEKRINELHIRVDEVCWLVFAKQAPVAKDLRFVLAVAKINSDLERMGDEAENIAHNGINYLQGQGPISTVMGDLEQMTQEARWMVKNALDALVYKDPALARRVLDRDEIVDSFRNRLFCELQQIMKQKTEWIEACLSLILIVRNLERIGDHATNIAEEVIFFTTGRDIRHSHG